MCFFFLEVVTFLGAFLADCLDGVFAILETTEEEEKSEHQHEETHQGHPTMPWQCQRMVSSARFQCLPRGMVVCLREESSEMQVFEKAEKKDACTAIGRFV